MAETAAARTCPTCSTAVTAEAVFCSSCGVALGAAGSPPSSARIKWYYNIWFVLCMLFFVAGPFGLPLVWKSPRFARWVKWLLTVVMVLYTWLLIDMTIRMTKAVLEHFSPLQSLF